MNAQQYLLREYLRLLWEDSEWQADWQAVRQGEMDFARFEQKWKLPRLLRRILIDASRESEEPTLQRLQEKIPAVEVSGYAILTPEGTLRVEPALPEKPLQALPEAEPSVETREAYLERVKATMLQERNFASLLQQIQSLPPEKREAYLRVLQGQEPRLLPEAQAKYPELSGHELEQQVILLAMRYYEECLKAITPRLTPKRFRNRQQNPAYLKHVALAIYLRIAKGMPYAEIQLELARRGYRWLSELTTIQRECAYWVQVLEIP